MSVEAREIARDDLRAYGGASGGQFPDRRDVEVAVGGQRQRARDRGRGEHQCVGVRRPSVSKHTATLEPQSSALVHAEAVLLVDEDEVERGELKPVLDERVRADHEQRFTAREARRELVATPGAWPLEVPQNVKDAPRRSPR